MNLPCGEHKQVALEWPTDTTILRRPLSLAGRVDHPDGQTDLHLIHRVVGAGTHWLAQRREGDTVSIIGPLGNHFTRPDHGAEALLVAGGVGIPPMLYLASHLHGYRTIAFCGALTRDLIPLSVPSGTSQAATSGAAGFELLANVPEFAEHGASAVISTDDGSFGYHGYVTDALEVYLKNRLAALDAAQGLRNAVLYTCGPEPMMKHVVELAVRYGLACQVAVERVMACGMGTCQSCVIRLRRDPKRDGKAFEGKDWIYKLACTDGPVFSGEDLLW